MKTLKFMLAAATAIGIASVASAGQNMKASTGFEKLKQGDKVFTGVRDNVDSDSDISSYFCYIGDNTDDNESEIVAFVDNATSVTRPTGVAKFDGADATSCANALQVSTGTDPLLRTFRPIAGKDPQDGEEITTSTYIDTLVQFTVTPSTDTVTPGGDDKLMIYLKEVAPTLDEDGAVVTVGSTNLVVMAGYLDADYKVTPREFVLLKDAVVPGAWYRLTVEAIPAVIGAEFASGDIGFRIKLDNKLLNTSEATFVENDDLIAVISDSEKVGSGITDGVVFLSLLTSATDACTLQAVGFAGEGLVDDLVITDLDPAVRTVNFTLSFDKDKVTALEYTVDGQCYYDTDADAEGKNVVADVAEGKTIEIISILYADGYEFDSFTPTGLTAAGDNKFTVDGNVAASLTINAKAKAASEVTPGEAAVPAKTQEEAEALVIKATAPAGSGITDEAYTAYFKKVITKLDDNTFSVKAELNEEAVDPDATAADLASKFDEISEAGEVTVKAKPGLYYSVKQGSSLDAMEEGAREMATGDTVNLKAEKFTGGTGFYRIMVNFTDKQ